MLTVYEMNGPYNGKALLPTAKAFTGGQEISLETKQASGRAFVA